MQFVQAGLPGLGFEHWLSQKAMIPLNSGGIPKQDILRTYYGRLVTAVGDMDPVATRPLFRPAYFASLYSYWLAQRGNHGGLCMQALGQGLTTTQTSANEPEDLTEFAARPKAEAQAKAHERQKGQCDAVPTRRSHVQYESMDGRQAKGNAPVAPITQRIRKRTMNTHPQKMHSNATDGRGPCAAQKRGAPAQQEGTTSQGSRRHLLLRILLRSRCSRNKDALPNAGQTHFCRGHWEMQQPSCPTGLLRPHLPTLKEALLASSFCAGTSWGSQLSERNLKSCCSGKTLMSLF